VGTKHEYAIVLLKQGVKEQPESCYDKNELDGKSVDSLSARLRANDNVRSFNACQLTSRLSNARRKSAQLRSSCSRF
jgi:hypothetical protein